MTSGVFHSDGRQVTNNPGEDDRQYAEMFEEAMNLKMVPYDYRVWGRYYFSKAGDHKSVMDLFDVHHKLIHDHGHDAKTVGSWCKATTFYNNAFALLGSSKDDFFVYFREKMPYGYSRRQKEIENDSSFPKAWFDQAKACLLCSKCENNVDSALREKRYDYLVFGMIIWQIAPTPRMVLENVRLDVWYDLGYAAVPNDWKASLHYAYTKVLSPKIGVGAMTFDKYQKEHAVIMQEVLDIFCEVDSINRASPLYERLDSFFKNAPNNSVEGVWRLKHAISTGMNYESLLESPLFEVVATDYGFNNIYQQVNTTEVDKNLRHAYLTALNHEPIELHRAWETGHLHEFVIEACRVRVLPLLPETESVLELTGNVNRLLSENKNLITNKSQRTERATNESTNTR